MVQAMVEELKPAAAMVVVQTAFAGVNVLYKLSLNDGMDPRVLVFYRFFFAAVILLPLAFFVERGKRPTMTRMVLMESFFCGFLGGFIAQNFYVYSVKITSATFTSAMVNLTPAVTFVLAVLFGLERLGIRKIYGKLKILGTLLGVAGAMVLTLYKGPELNIWSTGINLLKTEPSSNGLHGGSHRVVGAICALSSCVAYAMWMIIQKKMTNVYPCPYSCTALMTLMASIQSGIFALCLVRDWSQWRLGYNIRLLSVGYVGLVGSGLILVIFVWCIETRGPVYAANFTPLMLILVAVLASLFLDEKLHLGCILGGVLIIVGLYIVLWGRRKEARASGESSRGTTRGSMDVAMVSGTTMDIGSQRGVRDLESGLGIQEKV